jgi:DNA repair protein RadC
MRTAGAPSPDGSAARIGPKAKNPPRRLKIRDWPESERPREKLLRSGPQALSDAELLALLIGSGCGGATAVDVGKDLISGNGGLASLASKNAPELSRMKGIGSATSARILAAFEIGRRAAGGSADDRRKVRSPEDVVRWFGPFLRDMRREAFRVLLLDGANRILRDCTVSEGTLNASLVHPREVFKPAVDHTAASVILMHNHPSGEADPSAEDRAVTAQLAEAGRLMGIPVIDHVIVAGDRYFSFAKEGLIKP